MKISVLLPVYSETGLLVQTIEQLRQQLGEKLLEFVIVVSPKSSRECLQLCQSLARNNPDIKSYVQSDRPGIGWAWREALPHASGTHALFINSDLETNPMDAGRLVKAAVETHADVVCASRWMRGGGFTGYDPVKLVFNYTYNLIFRTIYGISIHDITFGYKLVRMEVLRRIRWEYGRHEFGAEILLKPVRLGYSATEVPTRWVKRSEGESKQAFFRNLQFAAAAWKIRFADPETFLESASAIPAVTARVAG